MTASSRVLFFVVSLVTFDLLQSQECTSGFVGDLEGVLEGVNSSALTTNTNNNNLMYIYRSLTFTCDGVITGVRMVMPNREDRPQLSRQGVFMIIAVFSDSTVSDVIVLKNDDVHQIIPGTSIWSSDINKLNTAVRSGDYIGVAIPRDNITSESIYYQGIAIDSSSPFTQGSTFRLNYNDETEFEQMVSSATVSDGPGLQRPPLIQFTVEPASVVPSPTATPTATPTDTSTGPLPNVGTIIAGAVVGGVVFVLVVMTAILLPILLCVVYPRKRQGSKEFGPRMETSHHQSHAGFDNPHTNSPTSAQSPVGVPASNSSHPHSPTTGQLRTTPDAPEVVYALPQKRGGDYEMDPNYNYSPKFIPVPTVAQRNQFSGYMTSEDHYELPETQLTMDSSDYDFPSTESEHYWCPSKEEAELYRQLSEKKYQEILRRAVRLGDKIGEGEFGSVYKGEWQQWNGCVKEVAIKRLHDDDVKVQFLREAAVMGQFNHPHVARLFGVVTVGKPVMIVMEILSEGDLYTHLNSFNPSVDQDLPKCLLKFTRQICSGMVHLSSKRFVHRDLATRNVLLDQNLNCKIADFGMSRDVTNDYYLSQGGRIPLKWTSPEGILYHKYYPGSDVWSYGMVMYEIWSLGHKPYESMEPHKVVEMLSSGKNHCQPPPPGCPREIYSIMVKCWNWDHATRPTFQQISQLLDRDDSILSSIGEYSELVPADGLVLGSSLERAKFLHFDLQKMYDK